MAGAHPAPSLLAVGGILGVNQKTQDLAPSLCQVEGKHIEIDNHEKEQFCLSF